MSYIVQEAHGWSQCDHNKYLGFYDLKNKWILLPLCYTFHFFFYKDSVWRLDCLHCIAVLNEWTLLKDENKLKNEYMKSWEKDKMVDKKTL